MALSAEIIDLIRDLLTILRNHNETLCTAESITAGGLGYAITSVPGASHVYVGGLIAYRSEIKVSHLHVDQDVIEENSVVSEEVAMQMAQGALKTFGTTWAISTTGVAGPGPSGGVDAGTVWVAIAGPITQTLHLELSGEREIVRNATISSAIASFARILRTRS